jgi:hypothetical protein
MLRTSFSPGLDGVADWASMQPKDLSLWLLNRVFQEARTWVLEELHRPYFHAVEIYALDRHTLRWIERASLKACAQEAGQIYTALDYYWACLPLPGRMKALGPRKEAVFRWYFCQRSLDNLRANTAGLLQALAISSLLPDEWFPQKDLEILIKNEIRRSGMVREVEVDWDLNLAPGGLRWLAGATQRTVEEIRAKLAEGRPWPVRIICSPGGLPGNRQVIVYACQKQPGGGLRLEIFEPGCDLDEHALLIQTRGEKTSVMEIAPPGRPLPVLGLLWETYSPAPPPLECSPWWLRREGVRQVWRQLRRGCQMLRKLLKGEIV